MFPNPQVRLAQFRSSGFASFLLEVFQDNLTRSSQLSLLLLALGWTMSGRRHHVAAYVWHGGGAGFKHFSCYYTFLERSIYPKLDSFWCKIIVKAGPLVPEAEVSLPDAQCACQKDARAGRFEGEVGSQGSGRTVSLGRPPHSADED